MLKKESKSHLHSALPRMVRLLAKQLYEKFIEEVQKSGIKVQSGIFGAEMKVSLLNDGPVTLILERLHEE